jgi:hypothetical protein
VAEEDRLTKRNRNFPESPSLRTAALLPGKDVLGQTRIQQPCWNWKLPKKLCESRQGGYRSELLFHSGALPELVGDEEELP